MSSFSNNLDLLKRDINKVTKEINDIDDLMEASRKKFEEAEQIHEIEMENLKKQYRDKDYYREKLHEELEGVLYKWVYKE